MRVKVKLLLCLLVHCGILPRGTSLCAPGSYLNLCGYCVGGTFENNELEGLDRCGICEGQGSCVGCDGIINSPRRRDLCGLCLLPGATQWNDCRVIDRVHPRLLDLAVDRGLVSVTLTGAGLRASYGNNTRCLVLPMDTKMEGHLPIVKEIELEDESIRMKILLADSTGRYKIGCSEVEGFAELRVVDSRKLNVVRIYPAEVNIGELVQLRVEIDEDRSGNVNGTYWCFVRGPGRATRTIPAVAVSPTLFSCSGFVASVPERLGIGLVAHEDIRENDTGRVAELIVRGKAPKAEVAEYAPDLRRISVKFDQNVDILDCGSIFSSETEESFGKNYSCVTVGDTLFVTLGHGSDPPRKLEITPRISSGPAPIVIPVSDEKVEAPSFGLLVPNIVCPDMESMKVKLSWSGYRRLERRWSVIAVNDWRGRSQRENLVMWKSVRSVEADLNDDDDGVLHFENLLPGASYVLRLDIENGLRILTSFVRVAERGNLSMAVAAYPSSMALVAEAQVTHCGAADDRDVTYSWAVNGETGSEDGSLLILRNVNPERQNVSFTVRDRGQTLGTAWIATEMTNVPGRIVVSPAEIVVGTMDEIVLHALSTHGEVRGRWSCETYQKEPCLVAGPNPRMATEVANVSSSILRIPAGVLPVGGYVWTIDGSDETKAYVIVAPRIPPRISVKPVPPGVDSSKSLFVNAEVQRLQAECKLGWRVVRKKGYDFFDLKNDIGLGDYVRIRPDDFTTEEREAPLVVPPATGNWKGLAGGAKYLLRLETSCPEPVPEAHVDVPVLVNTPPRPSHFRVTPDKGSAITTRFTVEVSRDTVEEYPLVHHWSYSDNSEDIMMKSTTFDRTEFVLPPGNLTVTVRTCDMQNSCSRASKMVEVLQPSIVEPQLVENIALEVKHLMLSGDTAAAYHLAIASFKTLSADKRALDELSSRVESAVKDRLRDLSRRLDDSDAAADLCLGFFKQSVMNLKHFPDTQELVKALTEFKNRVAVTMKLRRVKRSSMEVARRINRRDANDLESKVSTAKAIFDLQGRNMEQNATAANGEDLEKDVRKYMVEICKELQDAVGEPVLIDSSTVTLKIAKMSQSDLKKELLVGDKSKVKLELKAPPRKACLAVASYKKGFTDNNTAERLSDVYEVRFIQNGTILGESDVKSLSITLPVSNSTNDTNVYCATWRETWKTGECSGNSSGDGTITCDCPAFAVVAAFPADGNVSAPITTTPVPVQSSSSIAIEPASTSAGTIAITSTSTTTSTSATTPTSATTSTSATSTTTANTSTAAVTILQTTSSTSSSTVRSTPAPVTTTVNISTNATTMTTTTIVTTTDGDEIHRIMEDISRRKSNAPGAHISGTFKITDDFDKIVGKNESVFRESMKRQISQQLKVPLAVVSEVIVRSGSIIVTAVFVDTKEVKAEAAIEELMRKLRDGNLLLIGGPDARVLSVPRQDLKVKIGQNKGRDPSRLRLITYGVVSATFLAIFLLVLAAAYCKRLRSRAPMRLPRLSIDDHPTYRQFYNEFSLDGSSTSLDRYRREQTFESETSQ